MSRTSPPPTPTPPPSASPTYNLLFTTALSFIAAQAQTPSLPLRMDFPRLRTLCTPSFTHSWGHNYSVSLAPPLQGVHSLDAFIQHLQGMLPKLESWRADVTDVVVDEARLKVVLRASFWMRARGGEGEGERGEEVENDLMWVLEMEGGAGEEGVRVRKSVEFIDGVAAGRLKELMMRKG